MSNPSESPSAGPGPGQPLLDRTVSALRDPRLRFDLGLSAGLAVVSLLFAVVAAPTTDPVAVLATGGVLLGVLGRRVLPTPALGLAIGAALVLVISTRIPSFVIVAVPIMIYTNARWSALGQARLALLAGWVGSVLGPLRWVAGGIDVSRVIFFLILATACFGTVSAAYLIGRRRNDAVVTRDQQLAAAAERSRLIAAEQDQRARSAAVVERQRIARDLHDIVAHSLSVIVVQAEGGRALTSKHPERAPEVLATIADAGREALEEMRAMVGLLRNENEEAASRRPAPGLADLPELVRRTSDRVQLVVHGVVPVVSAPLGLTAYRTVQESLTNMLKHAGPQAWGQVRVEYGPTAIRITVRDDGRGAAAWSDGQGHGLQGMSERISLHGGTLTAGPQPGGGFVVAALLPLRGSPGATGGLDQAGVPHP